MKQLIQNFKTGKIYIDEVPVPALSEGMVLVENKYSLISVGTERGTVKVAQAGLLGKAKQRPDLVTQVIKNIKKEGLSATVGKVRTKLDTYKALGYSTAGIVLASMDTGGIFKPGDRVACAGQDYASHAEVIAVPQNLIARIPENVSYDEAAFTTLGAIALQGIRQANPRLGEKICVIGLGLLGQITCQLAKANGCDVFGIDINPSPVEFTGKLSDIKTMVRNDPNLLPDCNHFTRGYGFDAVIITAASSSNDPIDLSSEIVKKKGTIIVVGAIKMDVKRDPHFYKKELELKMSCSYGPGRYDVNYEENGRDYPHAYVRWTEQRNMEAFLDLLSTNSIDIKPLISHVFDIAEAEKAYDLVLGKNHDTHNGILLKYAENGNKRVTLKTLSSEPVGKLSVGLIGAGSFAQSYLIPIIKSRGATLTGVVTTRGITSKNVAEKFKFQFCSTEPEDIFNNDNINMVFVATTHASHAALVRKALQSGKHVFVEKPLTIHPEELKDIAVLQEKTKSLLMVGFNRRFAPVSKSLKKKFETLNDPLVIHIRINAGFIPRNHWSQQPEIGGGRIVGEACHFIDLMQYFTNEEPVKVYAESTESQDVNAVQEDNFTTVIKFSGGSVGTLTYIANGDTSLPKEKIEIFGGGNVGIINDFRKGSYYHNGKITKLKSPGKGHHEEVTAFLNAVEKGKESSIPFRSVYLTTLTTFKILDSLHTGLPQEISLDE